MSHPTRPFGAFRSAPRRPFSQKLRRVDSPAQPHSQRRVGLPALTKQTPPPSARALRRALAEVARRGKLTDVRDFARDLRIDLGDNRKAAGGIAPARDRAIERSALGAFVGLCCAAAAMFALEHGTQTLTPDPRFELSDALIAQGEYATASITPATPQPADLGADDLAALLADRPLRCVPMGQAPHSGALGLGLGKALATSGVKSACAEEIRYEPKQGAFTARIALAAGGVLEINGAYSIEQGAICHWTNGMTAHVMSASLTPRQIRREETVAQAAIDRRDGAPICHRYRATGNGLFTAEIFGAPTDFRAPTPFEMRPVR